MCPIGAADGLVNRIAANLPFAHRIRVAKERCTGCNICARDCMCGAIKMVDKIAVVDQVSCMSCHECVDVCDWNALAWTTPPRHSINDPKRVKKNTEILPVPDWQAVSFDTNKVDAAAGVAARGPAVSWVSVVNSMILLTVISIVIVGSFL
jgi:formate hydrogenlyase subunit 6/NADH:ubiquinone oxidoreductase subunit I